MKKNLSGASSSGTDSLFADLDSAANFSDDDSGDDDSGYESVDSMKTVFQFKKGRRNAVVECS